MAHPAPEAVVEGLWALSEESERRGDISSAVKCLEAALQRGGALLPLPEIRLRLRLASLLLSHTHNLPHAKSHLERASLLLTRIPAALPLKLAANSLLSRCYQTTAALPSQKKTILQSLRLLDSDSSSSLPDPRSRLLWSCNFNAQLATALTSESDHPAALSALESALADASKLRIPALELFFAASALHVQLLHWGDAGSVESAARRSAELWESLPTDVQRRSPGLFFYQELLQTFYLLRLCDYKAASRNADRLDTAVKEDRENVRRLQGLAVELEDVNRSLSEGSGLARKERLALGEKQRLLQEQLRDSGGFEFFGGRWVLGDMLQLAPPSVDGEWLPRSAVYALVDLVVVMLGRPKGVFKECGRRIESGMKLIHEELMKLGVGDGVGEADLQSSAILMASQYLMLLMQFLENKVVVELTRSEFVEAQQALMQMKNLFIRFPAILQGCEYIIEMLRGQYAHSVGCLHEAAFHFLEATKLTESKSMQSMGQIYAAVSYICIGDAESSAQALDLVRPVYNMMDCFVGVREKTCIIFSYGLLLMRQHNPQEARIRLASGLKIAHQQLGNIQLVSQFLTILGSLALQLHDTGQAREILKSSLTLAKTLYDVPTQIWVLSILTDLYRELGEKGNEMENSEYQRKKEDDLQKRLSEVHSRIHHLELIEKARINLCTPHELDIKRAIAGPSIMVDLDIPESIGLPNPPPASSISRLRDVDSVRHTRKKI